MKYKHEITRKPIRDRQDQKDVFDTAWGSVSRGDCFVLRYQGGLMSAVKIEIQPDDPPTRAVVQDNFTWYDFSYGPLGGWWRPGNAIIWRLREGGYEESEPFVRLD